MTTPGINATDVWTLGQVVFGEARGEPHEGQVAVGYVVLNRQRLHPRWQGKSIAAICTARWQFSCFNPSDPNYPQLQRLTVTSPGFAGCLRVVLDVLTGAVPSPVGDSTHYFRSDMDPWPRWAQGKQPLVVLGHHAFLENIP